MLVYLIIPLYIYTAPKKTGIEEHKISGARAPQNSAHEVSALAGIRVWIHIVIRAKLAKMCVLHPHPPPPPPPLHHHHEQVPYIYGKPNYQ